MQLMPRISRKVLTQQLRELERDDLIQRQTYSESPPRVEYSLTSLGETLEPITDLMCDWGKEQLPEFNFGLLNLEGLNIWVATEESNFTEQLRVELGTIRGAQVTTTSVVSLSERLVQIQPDVIIIDLNNLGADSEASIEQTRLITTGFSRSIPIIALAEQLETRTQAFSEGFKLILAKPVEPSELVAAIANVTGRLG